MKALDFHEPVADHVRTVTRAGRKVRLVGPVSRFGAGADNSSFGRGKDCRRPPVQWGRVHCRETRSRISCLPSLGVDPVALALVKESNPVGAFILDRLPRLDTRPRSNIDPALVRIATWLAVAAGARLKASTDPAASAVTAVRWMCHCASRPLHLDAVAACVCRCLRSIYERALRAYTYLAMREHLGGTNG